MVMPRPRIAWITGTMSRISDGLRPASTSSSSSSFGLDRERARKLEPLAPRDGEVRGRKLEHRRKADRLRDLLGGGERGGAAAARQVGADRDVLAHREAGERLGDLERARDAAPRQQCGGCR